MCDPYSTSQGSGLWRALIPNESIFFRFGNSEVVGAVARDAEIGDTEVSRGADVGSAVDGFFSRRQKIFRMSGIIWDREITERDTCQGQDGGKEKK